MLHNLDELLVDDVYLPATRAKRARLVRARRADRAARDRAAASARVVALCADMTEPVGIRSQG